MPHSRRKKNKSGQQGPQRQNTAKGGHRGPIASDCKGTLPKPNATTGDPRWHLANTNNKTNACRANGKGEINHPGPKNDQNNGNATENWHQASGSKIIRPMGYRRLEELLDKDSSELLLTLGLQNNGFFMLLNSPDTIRRDLMVLVLEALGILCTSDCHNNLDSFLNKVISQAPNFMTKQVNNFLMQLQTTACNEAHLNSLRYLLIFLKQTHASIPKASSSSVRSVVDVFIKTLQMLKLRSSGNTSFFENMLIHLNKLSQQLEEFCKQNRQMMQRRYTTTSSPPNNFREIPIFPRKEDIFLQNDPFLRRNVTEGKYANVEHYLDVQFRLLREDLIRPLREAVHEYTLSINRKRPVSNQIRLYTNVHIWASCVANNGIRHRISFDVTKLKNVCWQNSKRLLTGSLLCLSADGFKTMLFATVADREIKDIRKGILEIQFSDIDNQVLDILPSTVYVMVESEAYFEAFRHNLVALQSINEGNFSMKRYIVDLDTNIRLPSYVSQQIVTNFQRIKQYRLHRNKLAIDQACNQREKVPIDQACIQSKKLPVDQACIQRNKLPVDQACIQRNKLPIGLACSQRNKETISLNDSNQSVGCIRYLWSCLVTVFLFCFWPSALARKNKPESCNDPSPLVSKDKANSCGYSSTLVNVNKANCSYSSTLVNDNREWLLDSWLNNIVSSFDDWQLAAFEAALTKELAIIQGPPGTGKTFIALKIVETLLSDSTYWISDRFPILVVCYTNHALDQFLEGISRYTDSIARIGGRCQNDNLEKFTLRSIRKKKKDARNISFHVHSSIHASRTKLHMLKQEIQEAELKIAHGLDSVMSVEELNEFMVSTHLSQFRNCLSSTSNVLQEWLGTQFIQKVPDSIIQKLLFQVHSFYQTLDELKTNIRLHDFKNQGKTAESLTVSSDSLTSSLCKEALPRQMQSLLEELVGARLNKGAKLSTNTLTKVCGKINDILSMLEKVKNRLDKSMKSPVSIEQLESILFPLLSSKFQSIQDCFSLDSLFGVAESSDYTETQQVESDDDEDLCYLENMRIIDEEDDEERLSQSQDELRRKVQLKRLSAFLESNLTSGNQMSESEACSVKNVWTLDANSRLRLYRYWVRKFLATTKQHLLQVQREYVEELKVFEELRKEEDYDVIRDVKIVAMTTTGAAKYRFLVGRLNPRILIVEEAAEVLEAHIVTSLTQNLKHIILIGDHKQLRPSTTVYELAKCFGLDVSLFERMVGNGMDYYQLTQQHRMRPCISSLLTPAIYAKLTDHSSVTKYERVKGVEKDMFFVTHNQPEDAHKDGKSYKNAHEAEFIVELCDYFMLQGYRSSQITILTTYSGQLLLIKQFLASKPRCKDVRATGVDNYQGEENDIVLLSFVRSNKRGNAGFLKTENRVCVALSRAKRGMFCIGNFVELLADKSPLWKKIVSSLRDKNAIGCKLTLQCQNHPEKKALVSKASDISLSAPKGGCTSPCGSRLPCGHICPLICHMYDREHNNFICQQQCLKVRCPVASHKKCQQKCHLGKPCPKCSEPVPKSLPCGHTVTVPCAKSADDVQCLQPCTKLLPCGHKCKEICSRPCTTFCSVQVQSQMACGHRVKAECGNLARKRLEKCYVPVSKSLPCGHTNTVPCAKSADDVQCLQPCKKLLPCGHKCKEICSRPCTTFCSVQVQSQMACGHQVKAECGNLASKLLEKCYIPVSKSLPCGHTVTVPCFSSVVDMSCYKPCKELLACGHNCKEVCGHDCRPACKEGCANLGEKKRPALFSVFRFFRT